ncbi:MAG: Fe-S oxidoreductase [Bacteroidetes bacterium]|nr:Fe-S oxidoreductase [Bacteroidota bacterium]
MAELKEIAKELLTSGTVAYIIGYASEKNDKTVPFIARTVEDAEKLVFTHHSVNNLSVYLKRIKKPESGKVGLVVKGCDLKAVVALIQESQSKREDIYIISPKCNTVVSDNTKPWNKDNIASKCLSCEVRTPSLFDATFGEIETVELPSDEQIELIKKVEAMSTSEKWEFWKNEFEKCVKCYACRQACPLCYCDQCIVDKASPRWIDSSATVQGNFAWNMIRAFHLSGRCIGCEECNRVCPVDIPLSLLNRKMSMFAVSEYDYKAGTSIEEPTLVGTYKLTDNEDFIK